jgi:hypothetical protein
MAACAGARALQSSVTGVACAGVICIGRSDGVVEVWDLTDRSHEAVLTAAVSSSAIAALCFSPVPAVGAGPSTARHSVQLLAAGASCCWLDLDPWNRHGGYGKLEVDLL